ncbi:MAG: hypothetical protein M0C28_27255 [Candidatus Moduliflexus flocculans]|nr:hypothetical protein [Candidatus Moduliflexus flocculans]
MQVQIEREIYIRASRSYAVLSDAIRTFKGYLESGVAANAPEYYRARNLLKEGKAFYEQAIQDAKKLLGPHPDLRAHGLREAADQARSSRTGSSSRARRPKICCEELLADDFLKTLMAPEEIDAYVRDRYEAQRSGKRKLANIKIRMVLDRLAGLVAEGQELQQNGPAQAAGPAGLNRRLPRDRFSRQYLILPNPPRSGSAS